MLKIERKWAMPSRWTFSITPIKELLQEELTDGLWIDPFAGKHSPANITNDLNTSMNTTYHLDALEFMRLFDDMSIDGMLFDPPYSPRQVKECYASIGIEKGWDGRVTFWSNLRDEIARVVKPGGKVISFGWNSMGCGNSRGFDLQRVLLVPHGGTHNDTICTVEIKRGL